jgi:hypothetical protein
LKVISFTINLGKLAVPICPWKARPFWITVLEICYFFKTSHFSYFSQSQVRLITCGLCNHPPPHCDPIQTLKDTRLLTFHSISCTLIQNSSSFLLSLFFDVFWPTSSGSHIFLVFFMLLQNLYLLFKSMTSFTDAQIIFLVSLLCGQTSSENCTFLTLSAASTTTVPTNCVYTLCENNPNICRIRLDFLVRLCLHCKIIDALKISIIFGLGYQISKFRPL